MIHPKLHNKELRFVLLRPKAKTPFETEWQKNGYTYDDPKLQKHIESGGNFGVIGGHGNLRIIDIDDVALGQRMEKQLNTYTVQTGSGGKHFYIYSDYATNHVFKNGQGEYRAHNYQVVCASCTHPNGKKYETLHDKPILKLPTEEVKKILEPLLRPTNEYTETTETSDTSRSGHEFAEVCRLIKEGKNKDQIFRHMQNYSKWSTAHPAYRETTYNNAKKATQQQPQQNALILLASNRRSEATEVITKQFLEKHYVYTTRDDQKSEMWIYKGGIYKPDGKTYVREHCRQTIGDAYTNHIANEVISKIETDTFIESAELFKNLYPNEIVTENNIINVVTKETEEHTPNKIFFNKIPVTYDPRKDCPNVKKHFETVLKNKDDIPVIQELFGYCLLKDYRYEKAFMFTGDGRNGKGKTLELIKHFVGVENCCNISLQQLEKDDYAMGELLNKLVNTAADINSNTIKESNYLKSLTGRDLISAQRKFLPMVNFVNYAKMIFCANEVPRIKDDSFAIWNRMILIEFPYFFVSQQEYDKTKEKEKHKYRVMDVDIVKKLTTPDELSGLLNWALEGLQRLLKNKKFSYSKSTEDVKALWIKKSDSFKAFVSEHLIVDFESDIPKKMLRQCYTKYCRENKLRTVSDRHIKYVFEDMGVIDGRDASISRERIWEGVRFGQDVQDVHGFQPHSQISNSAMESEPPTTLDKLDRFVKK